MARPYSFDFYAPADEHPAQYNLSRIPLRLWQKVLARKNKEKVSLRFVILRLLERWADGRIDLGPEGPVSR